jgi:hypothetical protein
VKQVPTAHVSSALHAPMTCDTVHGPESGGVSPPHARVSMHWKTSMQVAPIVHSASVVHAPLGKQSGPACELVGVLPGGHDSGGGPTASARTGAVASEKRTARTTTIAR